MVIVHMNHLWQCIPCVHPMNCCNLESKEPLSVIIITIYLLPVEQTIDVNQKQFKALCIGLFFDHGIIEPPMAKIGGGLVHHFPVMRIQICSPVHGHEHL